jgi:3(or 17)beta-hydroxysteroid dehydrogenase
MNEQPNNKIQKRGGRHVTESLEGKIALVTGGGRAIGAATAKLLAQRGAEVLVSDIATQEAEAVVANICAEGGRAIALSLDVRSEAGWQTVHGFIGSRFPKLDILVNNAAVELFGPSEEITLEEWRAVQAVNVEGLFLGAKTLLPLLKAVHRETPGATSSVINLSSVAGIIGRPDQLAYMSSKGAVRSMSKGLAIEYASKGFNIRVNSVHPGGIETPMLKNVLQYRVDEEIIPAKTLAEAQQLMADFHPLGRLGQPEDIANGVAFLASEASSFMTGTELVIDGGWTAQ